MNSAVATTEPITIQAISKGLRRALAVCTVEWLLRVGNNHLGFEEVLAVELEELFDAFFPVDHVQKEFELSGAL